MHACVCTLVLILTAVTVISMFPFEKLCSATLLFHGSVCLMNTLVCSHYSRSPIFLFLNSEPVNQLLLLNYLIKLLTILLDMFYDFCSDILTLHNNQ